MPVQILFIQGAGAHVHDDWDAKLVASLARQLGPDYDVRYPRMPDEADPRYAAWKPALERELAALPAGSILVGHSVGGTMLLHALADAPPAARPAALILLAAPFIGPSGWPSDELHARTDFDTRLASLPILLFHGTADETAPVAHVHLYAAVLPHATIRVLPDRDHQLGNDLTEVAHDIRALPARAK